VRPPTPFLFDLDGTLADTLPDIASSTNHVRALHELPPLPLPAVRELVGDGALTLLRRALAPCLPAEPAAAAAMLATAYQRYTEHHQQACTGQARLFPGVGQELQRLAALGHPLAVVTNKPLALAQRVVHHLGLDELLPVVIGGDSLPVKKPDPAPLRLALQSLGLPATTPATMVGDGIQDLRAGKNLGLATIACLYGYGDPEALRRERADTYWSAFGTPEAADDGDPISGTIAPDPAPDVRQSSRGRPAP